MKLHLHHETTPKSTPMREQSWIRRRPSQGFTLIELMITVAIVAILAAIAIPNYRNYVIRGQLVDATTALAALRANMERYYQDNRTYIGSVAFPSPCDAAPFPAGNFTITCPTTALTTFSLQAKGTAGDLSGFTFTVDQADNQVTTVAPPAPSSFLGCPTAWITKTGGC
jgi:prepilin-type N-terminal cleavage/methylation domain-containing protein